MACKSFLGADAYANKGAVAIAVAVLLVLQPWRSALFAQSADGAPIDFQRDVQPIFSEHCLQCHGADAQSRQSDLRLDVRDAALRGGQSEKPALVPGKPEASELIARLTTGEGDLRMPPHSTKRSLSPEQVSVLERWIREGAAYAEHWAFVPPKPPKQPAPGSRHPIDQLVEAELAKRGLKPSSPEKESTLCRRLYLDLIGLPPSIADLEDFKKVGVVATTERLLGSERFGEKWARHWLDVARYSDTNGYEKDLRRDQWAWRDWVVESMNRDQPYNQFLIEQIAGDLLPGATQEQITATGFLRNSMLNEEGAIVAEQFRMFEMFDRMDCIGKAVLGLTVQCAQCHNHKFDPLSQDEYYGMFAFLNNAYEAQSWIYNRQQQEKRAEVLKAIATIDDDIRKARSDWKSELEAWAAKQLEYEQQFEWKPLKMTQLESISGLNHPIQLEDGSILMLGHTSSDVFFVSTPELSKATGLRLEVLNHGDLPLRGPGRSSTGGWGILEIEAHAQLPDKKEWEKIKLRNPTADFAEIQQDLDGKKKKGPVDYLIDGSDDTYWQADRGLGRRNSPSVAAVAFDKPLEYPAGTKFKFVMRMNSMVGCCRISLTNRPNPRVESIDYGAILALQNSPAERSEEQSRQIFAAWAKSLQGLSELMEKREAAWKNFPTAETSVLHLKEREMARSRSTFRLERGEWDRPRERTLPHAPAFLHRMTENGQANRLTFAKWLASEQSPLAARVEVNRVWQAIFGEGLVETSEDFGTRAPIPEHRDVLDWLAVDFMKSGWSRKHLIRTIVSSSTYQQSSRASPELLQVDPRNRLLARGPRFRCEAEVMRDVALSIAGLITLRAGGPSVLPPVPQNVLDYNYVYPGYWTAAQGAERYRRSLYVFRKRSMPDPVLSNLDAPNGDMACARRIRSNTPLAALTGLNETIFVEAAQGLALRVLREGGTSDAQRVDFAFQLCTGRPCQSDERQELLDYLASMRKRIAEGWLNAREISTGSATGLPALPPTATPQDAAAWTLTGRVLLNLDETLTKN